MKIRRTHIEEVREKVNGNGCLNWWAAQQPAGWWAAQQPAGRWAAEQLPAGCWAAQHPAGCHLTIISLFVY